MTRRISQRFPNNHEQFMHNHGLCHEARTQLTSIAANIFTLPGKDNLAQGRRLVLHERGQLESGHTRHHVIGDHQLKCAWIALYQFECLLAVMGHYPRSHATHRFSHATRSGPNRDRTDADHRMRRQPLTFVVSQAEVVLDGCSGGQPQPAIANGTVLIWCYRLDSLVEDAAQQQSIIADPDALGSGLWLKIQQGHPQLAGQQLIDLRLDDRQIVEEGVDAAFG